MDSHVRVYLLMVLCFAAFSTPLSGLQLSCTRNGILEIWETRTNNNVTCSQLGSQPDQVTVSWEHATQGTLGTCPPTSSSQDSCTGKAFASVFNPVRTDNSQSVMTVDGTALTGTAAISVFAAALYCRTDMNGVQQDEKSCQMDLVYGADFGSPSVQLSRWTVSGTCPITKFYSARNTYECQWYQHKNGASVGTEVSTIKGTPTTSQDKYKSSTCTMTSDLPSDPGTYTYSLTVWPGGTSKTATFTQTVAVPVKPTTCSLGYVPENTSITCLCRADNLGSPQGRLRWFNGTGSNINNNVIDGPWGQSSLEMTSSVVVRGDDNRLILRCQVDWNNRVYNSDDVTVRVGYGLTAATLQLNSEVSEGQPVTLTCTSSGGRPVANVTTMRSGVTGQVLDSGTAQSQYTLDKAECVNAGSYTCVAGNGMGPDVHDTQQLRVKCKPRTSGSQTGDLDSIDYRNQSVSVLFDVIAYPPPDVTVFFLGPSLNGTPASSVSSSVSLVGSCNQGNDLHTARCNVTLVAMRSRDAEGFYGVTVRNSEGAANFTMRIVYDRSSGPFTESESQVGVIVGSVVAVVMVVGAVAVVVVVIFIRRKRGRQDDSNKNQAVGPIRHQISNTDSNNEPAMGDDYSQPTGPYESLELSDVGQRSVYSGLTSGAHTEYYNTAMEPEQQGRGTYESLQLGDIGQKSVYTDLQTRKKFSTKSNSNDDGAEYQNFQ